MLDHVHIFHRGGLVLWSRSYVPSPSPIRTFIKEGLIEQTTIGLIDHPSSHEIQLGTHSLQWNFSNQFGLVFVVVYQRILQLTYINKLLESMNHMFVTLYAPLLERHFKEWVIPDLKLNEGFQELWQGWDLKFNQILRDIERIGGRKSDMIGSNQQQALKLQQIADRERADESQSKQEQEVIPMSLTTTTDSEVIAKNIGALKSRKKKGSSAQSSKNNSRAGSRSGTDTESGKIPKINQSGKKQARKWDNGKITQDDMVEYDYSDHVKKSDGQNLESNLVDQSSFGHLNQQGLYEVADYDQGRGSGSQKPQTIFTKILSSIPFLSQISEPIILTQNDLRPILDRIQTTLMKKNVAQEIAVKVCDRIELDLVGKELVNRSDSLKRLVYESLETSLTKILTPKSSVDIIQDVQQKRKNFGRLIRTGPNQSTEPYVITFVGVNGVGKSTNLSKVAFWLLQNRIKVLIAACDTFRSGAVEQLRVHVNNLSKFDCHQSIEKDNNGQKIPIVELYEKGYGKDAAGIAKSAIEFARENQFDVVLIDTAGRMQDNEPLMRALGKLVSVNQPDKIVFVGEALVGNEAVDQLSKFDQSLKKFSSLEIRGTDRQFKPPRGIDGIILTKFDTIDDQVGAALSMTYITGQPILFVGTGQTYTDLRSLRVNHIVDALLRD